MAAEVPDGALRSLGRTEHPRDNFAGAERARLVSRGCPDQVVREPMWSAVSSASAEWA